MDNSRIQDSKYENNLSFVSTHNPHHTLRKLADHHNQCTSGQEMVKKSVYLWQKKYDYFIYSTIGINVHGENALKEAAAFEAPSQTKEEFSGNDTGWFF